MKNFIVLSVLIALTTLVFAAQGGDDFGPPGFGPGGPGFGPGGFGPPGFGPGFGPGGPGFPGDFGPPEGFGGFPGDFTSKEGRFEDEGDQFRRVGIAEVAPGVEVNFGGDTRGPGFGPGRVMPSFERIDEDEMLLGMLGPVLFSKLGDPEETLGPLCPDIDAIGAKARELLADADFSEVCAEPEAMAESCSDAAEMCEFAKGVGGPRGPGGEEITCPVDEAKLLVACKERFAKRQQEGKRHAEEQCSSTWQSQGAGLQQRCQQKEFTEQYRDFRPQFEHRDFRDFEREMRERQPQGQPFEREGEFPGQPPGGFPGGQPPGGQFPGQPPGEFPGGQFPGQPPGEFPGGQPPGGFPGQPPTGFPTQPPGGVPPAGTPPSGFPTSGSPESTSTSTTSTTSAGSATTSTAPVSSTSPAPDSGGSTAPIAGTQTTSASRVTGLTVGGPGDFGPPGGFGSGGPGFGPGDFGPPEGFGPGGPGGFGGGPGPEFCKEEGFKENCLRGFTQFEQQNAKQMEKMCAFETRMSKRHFSMFCKQKEILKKRFGSDDPYEICVKQTQRGCEKAKNVANKCKAAANLDAAVELIKKKAKVECARFALYQKKARYAEAASTLEKLDFEGKTREDAVQVSATRDKIVLTAAELEQIKQEIRSDVLKDVMTLLGLNKESLQAAAEKQKQQVENLKEARDSVVEICEKTEGDSKTKCEAQVAKMNADITQLEAEAVSIEAKSGGILGTLGAILGGK